MADRFATFDELRDALAAASFDRPPAFVCNAHYTGLGVARALDAEDVPVVALDRTHDGVAPTSDAVALAGAVTYPLDDQAGFARDLETLADACDHAPVLFTCMDEWVHAAADTRPDGVRLSFSPDAVDPVLDKESLYAVAADLDVPTPETYRLAETRTGRDPTPDGVESLPELAADTAAERLGYPLVVKPARKREFEELLGTNVREVADADAFARVVATAADADVRLMAQERVDAVPGDDRSLAAYVPPAGDPLAVVGNARRRHPQPFGTACVVDRVDDPTVRARALAVLDATGYHGISEAEFVHDPARDEHVLLDVNTRPWKWIGMPVAAGANLPAAAYADAVGEDYDPGPSRDVRWLALRDYLASLDAGAEDLLSPSAWRSLVAGDDPGLVPAVYDPADPGPVVRLLRTEFGADEYYCAC
jgi:predicted ATP-grasp superfamily ATP-dependent carboligase